MGRTKEAAPALDAKTLEKLVLAPMPLGVSWTCSEYRRYLMGCGHRPVPSVAQIAALLGGEEARHCGVHAGRDTAGSRVELDGTTSTRAEGHFAQHR